MKDFLGVEAKVGDYFAYALIIGRSANQSIYQIREITEDGKVKAHKLIESYGQMSNREYYVKHRYKKWVHTKNEHGEYKSERVDMTEKEIEKVKNKTSTLSMFQERAIILNGFDPISLGIAE